MSSGMRAIVGGAVADSFARVAIKLTWKVSIPLLAIAVERGCLLHNRTQPRPATINHKQGPERCSERADQALQSSFSG
jgi:hypothetical protein